MDITPISGYERELTALYVSDPRDIEAMLRLRDCYGERSPGFAALSFTAQQVALATLVFTMRSEEATPEGLAAVLEWDVDDVLAAIREIRFANYALPPF